MSETVRFKGWDDAAKDKRIAELEATIAELKKDHDIALAESYRCGYEAGLQEKNDE